ncbi:MAG: Flp family type IVb pilin [Thermomicrobiales bacterium]|jgi:Flp pilus assembly pilin Flp
MAPFAEALYGLFVPEDAFAGQGLVEYALLMAFIAVTVIILAVVFLQGRLSGLFSRVGNSLGS